MYHQEPVPCNNLPSREAAVPKTVKVTAIPIEKVTESQKALFVSCLPLPPTYPIIRGTLVRAQGVKEVIIPAAKANKGANHIFAEIMLEITSSQ
jgi:hypothetical protein